MACLRRPPADKMLWDVARRQGEAVFGGAASPVAPPLRSPCRMWTAKPTPRQATPEPSGATAFCPARGRCRGLRLPPRPRGKGQRPRAAAVAFPKGLRARTPRRIAPDPAVRRGPLRRIRLPSRPGIRKGRHAAGSGRPRNPPPPRHATGTDRAWAARTRRVRGWACRQRPFSPGAPGGTRPRPCRAPWRSRLTRATCPFPAISTCGTGRPLAAARVNHALTEKFAADIAEQIAVRQDVARPEPPPPQAATLLRRARRA